MNHDLVNSVSFTLFLGLGFPCFIIGVLIMMKRKLPSKIPPGTLGWPLVGETLEFLKWSRKGAPTVYLESRVQKYGNIFTTHLVGHPTVVFCGPDGNRFLFSSENKLVQNSWPSSVGRLFRSSLITVVGDDARRVKRMLMTFLRAEALHKFIGRMDSTSRHHLDQHWMGKQEVTVYPLMKKYTLSLACDLFASIEDAHAMAELSHNFILLLKGTMQLPIDLPGTRYRKAKLAANAIREQLTKNIEERRIALRNGSASAEQDLLSFLLCNTVDEEKSLTDDEIKGNILLLLFAGHDTSSSTLTLLLKFLAENPHCYDQVLQEQLEIADSKKEGEFLEWEDLQRMKYSWRVVQETLRLQSPVQGAFRLAIKDFTYTGFTIPKGWKVYWTVNSTHFKSEHFSNPEKFDPSRFEGAGPAPYTFVPFGGGLRMCPGNEFARMEILVFLHNIVKKFRWSLMDSDEKISIDPMPAPLNGLPIKLQPQQL